MKNRWKAVVVVGLLTFLLGGCSPTPHGARAALEQHSDVLDAAAQDVLLALDAVGLPGSTAKGHIEACGGGLRPGVAYRTGGSVPVGDDLAAEVARVSQQLQEAGWKRIAETDGDRPSGRFTREAITLDVKTGGFKAGGVQYGADEMTFGLRIADACVPVPDGVDAGEFEDLEKDILLPED